MFSGLALLFDNAVYLEYERTGDINIVQMICFQFIVNFSAYKMCIRDRTGIDRCFAFCDCSCQTVTAGISAATAVVSRKGFTNCNFTRCV